MYEFEAFCFDIEAGKAIVILNDENAKQLDLFAMDRVVVKFNGKELIAVVDTTSKFVHPGQVGLFNDVSVVFGTLIVETGQYDTGCSYEHVVFHQRRSTPRLGSGIMGFLGLKKILDIDTESHDGVIVGRHGLFYRDLFPEDKIMTSYALHNSRVA